MTRTGSPRAPASSAWLFGAIALVAGCSTAPVRPTIEAGDDYRSTIEYLSALIRYEMARNSVTGLSIALVDDQRVVWADGFGFADREKKVPATAATVYRVGSISKLFTDTAAMQLVEQGRLELDQPVEKYVPGFSIRSRFAGAPPITPHNLMTHHSGLPRDLAVGAHPEPSSPFSAFAQALKEADAAYPPDLLCSYSNAGVTLLGMVVENVSQEPFAEHLARSVLRPIGMTHSSFDPGPSASPEMSRGYRSGQLAPEPPMSADLPAGGLNSSVADLSRFLAMVFAGGRSGDHQLLEPETLGEMLSPQNTGVPLDFAFRVGLGWFLDSSTWPNAGAIASHDGAIGQFRSQLSALPAHKLGVVVLANSGTAAGVVDHVASEALRLALEAKTGLRQSEPSKRAKVPLAEKPWPAEAQQEMVGDYLTFLGLAHIDRRGGALRATAGGRQFKLVPRADGELGVEYAWLGLIPVDLGPFDDASFSRRTVAGHEVLVANMGEREVLVGERLKPLVGVASWRQRLGEYQSVDRGDDEPYVAKVLLLEMNGRLLLEVAWADSSGALGSVRHLLLPVSDDEAILPGPLATAGEVIRRVDVDGEERLRLSGYTLRRARPK